MHCPKCRAEFVDGSVDCNDCGLKLVAGHPPPVAPAPSILDPGDPVILLESDDPVRIILAKASLEIAGIRYSTRGQWLQNLQPLGFKGGYTGLVQILIRKADGEAAVAVLREAERGGEGASK